MMATSSEQDRTLALVAYLLHLVGAIAGLPSLIGLVLNYLKRDTSGSQLSSHHRWMIRSFWWALLWVCVGLLSLIFLVGWAILGIAWLWYLYRHVRGLIGLLDGAPMPT